jgi:hypothetical protein
LGKIYDTKLSFNTHCDYIISKVSQKFVFLKTICPKVDAKTFLDLYKAYLLPILEYSNLCFSPNKTQIIKIEKVQKKVTKYICNKMKRFDLTYEQRLKYLELKSLENRRYIVNKS